MKWALIGICSVGIIICECLWHIIVGWDRVAVDIIYGLIICILMGAIVIKTISNA
ncbi:MAG: hypothetical protein IKL05_03455 [Clostridia bacterium]|nr:hypothetical protein [Clostridia bacterium]